MKTSKRVISLVLTAIMVMTSFVVAVPMLLVETDAATTIDGVSQTQIVTDTSVYDTYAANYLNGSSYSTGIVIPGLDPAQDYVIQGMTYYPARDWMLVTAYHNDATESSKVFALDAATGEFVAMFSFLNTDGSVNMDHGGGIAVSEHNIYYSCGDKDRKIAYAPLSALANAPVGQHTQIQLVAEADFVEVGSVSYDSKTAYTAYVCYDEGILWMGNFYDKGADLLGVTIAAADYNAPANNTYNSMVFGYRLKGNTSAEEWANLVSGSADCKGNPSYAVGLNNTLKDVQYATVDNGKLYLSRSYGSGAGNSINFGFGESSFLTVADIDLSVPGTQEIKISTTGTGSLDKTIMAYDISDYDDYPMMPMSEGLCVIGDDIFITFEGASNKYLNESSGITSIGNCEKPVDVIWQLDPYDLMEIEIAEPEKSIYYEKVYSMSEIENDKEYLIVYESAEKDPVTQENILYAFNAEGNFDGYKLSKSSASTVKGYNGMIGHPISDYDAVDNDNDGNVDILYLNDPEKDDDENVRWTLNRKSGDNFRITSTLSYFANGNNLYFDADQIGMAPSNADYLNELLLWQLFPGNGDFYFSNGQNYFLWCNDGTKAEYNSKINSYYANNSGATPIYAGISEQPGTFHCDAINATGSNIIGAAIPADDGHYYEGAFHLYKRVVDEVSSTYESRVYTNLGAELQEDGTYKVDLETYAISPNHYQYRGETPTDYIIVADTSSSMNNTGSTGISEYIDGDLAANKLCLESQLANDYGKPTTTDGSGNSSNVIGYAYSNSSYDIYFKHAEDGNMYKAYMGLRNEFKWNKGVLGIGKGWAFKQQYFYLYYVANDGYYYCFTNQEATPSLKYNQDEFKAWVAGTNGVVQTASSTASGKSSRINEVLIYGTHYRFDNVNSANTGEYTRISTLKNATSNLIGQIAAENSQNRVALVQIGADGSTGYYNTSGNLSQSGFTDALWSAGSASTLQSKASAFTASEQTNNNGIEFDYVNNIIANSGVTYIGEDSTRNVAVVYLSDGVVGADNQGATTTAANNNIAKALTAKKSGAFVYSVMIGADGTTFNRNLYMEAISSKYAEASSMTSLGGQSVDGVTYALSLATANINNYFNFGKVTLKEVAVNNAVGLENLDANSYIREQLSEAFVFPDDDSEYNVSVELVPGVFDKIGRFTFNENNKVQQTNGATGNVSWTVDTANRNIVVTNYDYSKQYIGRNRTTPGNKLRITITGLLANEDANIQNTSINDTSTTGVFKNQSKLNSNDAFKYLPTEYFNIPEYTYVLDYGLQMYDYDVNGTLKSVSADLSAQRDANGNLAYKSASENGLLEITNNNLDLLYSTTPTNFADSGYCLIQRDDGTYDWFEIKVVPASNVLFEEDYAPDKEGSTGAAWSKDGTTKTGYQTLTNENTDVYGYDSVYADSRNIHSYGSADKATVSTSAKRSVTKKFDFVGDGIDLISACGENTGIMIVKISGGDLAKPKAYMVDTYYGDGTIGDLICQTPIVSFRGNHGTYTVEATAAYLSNAGALQGKITGSTLAGGKLSGTTAVPVNTQEAKDMLADLGIDLGNADLEMVWFDDNSVLNGGTGAKGNVKTARDGSTVTSLDCYLDGFRIYHPMETANDDYIANEKDAQYINVIDSLKNNQIGTGSTVLDKIAYVTGSLTADENGAIPALAFSNYQSVGPQNELYLEGSKTATDEALVLQVSLPAPTSRVQLGLRAVTGTATVKVGSQQFTINSATEMYYDVTDCVTTENGIATITIQNTGSTLLAVNHIKLTGGAAAPILEEEALEYAMLSMAAPAEDAELINGVVTPIVPEDTTEPDTPVIPDDGGDDTQEPDAGDDDTTGDNSGTTGTTSFIEQLIAMIIDFIMSLFNFMPVGEVM